MSKETLSSKIPFFDDIKRSLRAAFLVFLVGRVLYSVWAIVVTQLVPTPLDPDPVLRPFYGQPALLDGIGGYLLGPWQRFDTLIYLWIAEEGYTNLTSVFPPLYPLLIRVVGTVLQGFPTVSAITADMVAAILISNVALILALTILHHLTTKEFGQETATRTIAYLVFFPTGFFLFAGYTESLFLMFSVAAFLLAKRDHPIVAGTLAFLASFTRLTGWVLFVPLVYRYVQKRTVNWRQWVWGLMSSSIPILGFLLFLLWRNIVGFPAIGQVYERLWYRSTGVPGVDLWSVAKSLLTGTGVRAGEFSLLLDFLVTIFLIVVLPLVFRRLGMSYGLYSASLLFFMLLPTSQLNPLYAYSRYALMFFPAFMLLGQFGRNPWVHRILLYSSLLLALFFSGQFFLWGWVA